MVSDKDGATVATNNRDPVALKETADAAFPIATGITQLPRNLRQRVQPRHHWSIFCKTTVHALEVRPRSAASHRVHLSLSARSRFARELLDTNTASECLDDLNAFRIVVQNGKSATSLT